MSATDRPNQDPDETRPGQPGEEDTEGHIFLPDPGAARELSRNREREYERHARERQRSQDARGRKETRR